MNWGGGSPLIFKNTIKLSQVSRNGEIWRLGDYHTEILSNVGNCLKLSKARCKEVHIKHPEILNTQVFGDSALRCHCQLLSHLSTTLPVYFIQKALSITRSHPQCTDWTNLKMEGGILVG